jgi:hypothetical protein
MYKMNGHTLRLPKSTPRDKGTDVPFKRMFETAADRGLVDETVKRAIRSAHKEGFIVQRYRSKLSSSIYLRFDFGMAGTLRVSDHAGVRECEYNVIIKDGHSEEGKNFFQHHDVHAIIEAVKKRRRTKAKELAKKHKSYSRERLEPDIEAASWGSMV